MKRDFGLWQAAGFGFTVLVGTLLHFLFELTGESVLVAPFSAVNESTWEHMKILFFPMFLFALVQRCFFGARRNFWSVKLGGIALGLALIPLLFYSVNGTFGKSPDWVNIGIFFVSAGLAFPLENRLFSIPPHSDRSSHPAFVLIILTAILFAVFTFFPPPLPLFADPQV